MNNKDLVELVVIEGLVEAEIIKSKLEAFEISSILKFEPVGRLLGITMDGLGKVKIMVRESDFKRAREVISTEKIGNSN